MDEQIEQDAQNGKLDDLAQQALKDHKVGKTIKCLSGRSRMMNFARHRTQGDETDTLKICNTKPCVSCQRFGQMPEAFTRQTQSNGFPLTYSQLDQFPDSRSRFAPLFPATHPQTPSNPPIKSHRIVVLQFAPIVRHPTLHARLLNAGPQAKESPIYGYSPTCDRF